jgi:hypothetical protein
MAMNLYNLTGYGAVTLPSMGRDGQDLVLAITAARYRLPHPASQPEHPLELDAEQPEPPLADIYCGPPGRSGLRIEGQTAFARPATDITVAGHARVLHDELVNRLQVTVSVGTCMLQALIVGDRIWDAGISTAQPFIAIPLVWERAFGGSVHDESGRLMDNEPRNPVGRGLTLNEGSGSGLLLPNIEDPRNLFRGPPHRPAPVGFGPVARWWAPRSAYAGTFDDAWIRDRSPVWPVDFDERFFCAAPAPLQASPHLRGGEPVYLEGLHRDGVMRFHLPALRMVARFRFNGRDVRRAMVLDAVIIEPDTGHITLIHRASAPAVSGIATHRETAIRHIERWEEEVA